MLNFWESDDFSLINMTESINTLPYAPSRIGAMNLFQGEGVTTKFVGIEMTDSTLHLIPTQPRGTMPEWKGVTSRNMRAVEIPHIPKNDALVADQVQGVREFGTEDQLMSPISAVNKKLETLKQEHELTKEWHRLGALQGKVLDADGVTEVYNWFTIFGVARTTINWDTTAGAAGLMAFATAIKRATGNAMAGIAYSRIHAFVGSDFFDKLTQHPDTIGAFESQAQTAGYVAEGGATPGNVFNFLGILWEEYPGLVGGNPLVPVAEGFTFPISNAGIYQERWAPGTFMEAVNTVGKEYYAKQEPLKFNTGVEIHTQSNPLFIVTKPKALLRLTYSV